MNPEGKVVLITGASEGIGAACAKAFRQQGARLALTARNRERLEQVAEPGELVIAADLREATACRSIAEGALAHYGGIDVLVNNAGQGLYTPAFEAPGEQVRALFELNLFAALELIQCVVPAMRKQGSGAIVNVASIAGQMTLPWCTVYSASKRALCALTDGLRMELRCDGIQAMSVCPGYVSTAFQSHVLAGEPPTALRRRRPFMITPEQCAAAIVRGLRRNARTVVTPGSSRLAVAASRLFPALVDRQLERMYRRTS